jgi:YVTN family beta-propeller protein
MILLPCSPVFFGARSPSSDATWYPMLLNGDPMAAGARAPSGAVSSYIAPDPISWSVVNLTVGPGPTGLTYDPADGYVYVPNAGSSNVTVLSGLGTVGSVNVGNETQSVVYDSGNGYAYAINAYSDNVSVISGTALLTTVNVGSQPVLAAYDSQNGFVYVANTMSDNVTIINGTSVQATLSAGLEPYAVALDPGNGLVYVTNLDSNNVTVIDGTAVVGSIAVGVQPWDILYDGRSGDLYVENSNSGNVSVINGMTVVGTVNVGSGPWSATYDPRTGYVYVSNSESSSVSVLSGTAVVATVAVGSEPESSAYDPDNGWVYVPDVVSGTVTVLNGTSVVGSAVVGQFPSPALYDGSDGDVYVANFGLGGFGTSTVSVLLPLEQYRVTFSEKGLPLGTPWWVNATGVAPTAADTSTVSFNTYNGTYSYTLATSDKQFESPGGNFAVNGAPRTVSVSFTEVTYAVTFNETGLAGGTTWTVELMPGSNLSSTTTSLTFHLANGTYTYLAISSGFTNVSGNLKISGPLPTAVTIGFLSTSTSPPKVPTTDLLIGGVIALAVALVAIGFLRRRRKGPPAAATAPGSSLPNGPGSP